MSESTTTEKSLFGEFPPVSREEWEKVIKEDLNGADYKQKLRWHTGEGIEPLAFYRREVMDEIERDSIIPKKYTDDSANAWEIREAIFADDISSANQKAKKALQRGAESLQFYLKIRRTQGMLGGDLQGLPIQNQNDFHQLLEDIPLRELALHFDSGLGSPALLAMLHNVTQTRNLDSQKIWSTFLYDPFSYVLLNGQLPKPENELTNDIKQISEFSLTQLPSVRPLGIDARTYHNSGGSIVQELAYAMSAASEYLSTLTESEFNIEEIADLFHFSFSVGSNYFLEIAKFRAARLLWQNIIEAYGGNPTENKAYLHGESSEWNKTLYDPYTNMLRTSTEGMSAAIAGCDSMTILPFDHHFQRPNEFSQRIARNQQLILSEEAYLDKVADPAAGSYYIEKLTEDLGQEAWNLFQDIETEGGLLKALHNGTIQSALEESQRKRDQAIAKRGRIFVGTNQYSNPDDNMGHKIDIPYQTVSLDETDNEIEIENDNFIKTLAQSFDNGATIGDAIDSLFNLGKHNIRVVNEYRGTKAFEELRLATEDHAHTPNVLTLPMGDKTWRKARSSFTANFFGCAGYNIEDPIGFEDVDSAIEAVKNQQPDIAVICSSDKEYKELVPAICEQLNKLENQPIVVLAGYPEEHIETYKKAGVDEFIYAKCNVLDTLKRFQQKLNVIEN